MMPIKPANDLSPTNQDPNTETFQGKVEKARTLLKEINEKFPDYVEMELADNLNGRDVGPRVVNTKLKSIHLKVNGKMTGKLLPVEELAQIVEEYSVATEQVARILNKPIANQVDFRAVQLFGSHLMRSNILAALNTPGGNAARLATLPDGNPAIICLHTIGGRGIVFATNAMSRLMNDKEQKLFGSERPIDSERRALEMLLPYLGEEELGEDES